MALVNRGVRLATLDYVGHMWEWFAMSAWILLFFFAVFEFHDIGLAAAAPLAVFGVHVFGGIGSWLEGSPADRWGRMNTTILLMAIFRFLRRPYWPFSPIHSQPLIST